MLLSNFLILVILNVEDNDDELNNVFLKDNKGFIIGIDLDELYDEL